MPMFTICTAYIPEGELEKQIDGFREAEKRFTREIGVLERNFYQCVQQPHIIWSNTKWTTEKAHNEAAHGIMKVRKDDRIGAAYFQPGLYFEIFCKEMEEVSYKSSSSTPAELTVICHGLIAVKKQEGWNRILLDFFRELQNVKGLNSVRTFYNYYNSSEFVGFMEWSNKEAYEKNRMIEDLTIEEQCYTGLRTGSSMLASFNQFYCKPLKIK